MSAALLAIYDYMSPFEEAAASVFAAAQFNAYTPLGEQILAQNLADSESDKKTQFQLKRPRVQLMMNPGANGGRLHTTPVNGRRKNSGHRRDQARQSTLVIRCVTEANIVQHRAYIAQVLAIIDTLAHAVNQTGKMPLHVADSLTCNGGDALYKDTEGLFNSNLNCTVNISVNANAWDSVTAEL